ncbi:hypothetical protein Scep_022811 [Stephania cephalantha]|uniref:Uncharacterized protein n=1 Tax=Stephania cephalantha TaxID=152367 RepID=A0AAP0F8R6_9MAGN
MGGGRCHAGDRLPWWTRISQTISYRKSKQLTHITNVVDDEASSAHSFGSSSSDSSEEKWVQVEEGNMEQEGKKNKWDVEESEECSEEESDEES